MKQIFPIINAILAAGLVILLFYACLPILGAQAAQFNPAPQTTPDVIQAAACKSAGQR